MKEDYIGKTRKWIEEFIIHHSICPFASTPYTTDKIDFLVVTSTDVEEWIKDAHFFCNKILTVGRQKISNGFIIYPHQLSDFTDFLDWQQLLEFHLSDSELDRHIQLVGFHPDFQYSDATFDDPANKTNRSPFPMLHFLRVEEVAEAIKSYGDTTLISERNIAFLRNKNIT